MGRWRRPAGKCRYCSAGPGWRGGAAVCRVLCCHPVVKAGYCSPGTAPAHGRARGHAREVPPPPPRAHCRRVLGAQSRGRSTAITVSATASCPLPEAALVRPALGMPLAAPASGWRGVSVPGPALLTARGRKGTGGAFPAVGSGQELPRLELERPEEGKEGENQGHLGSTRLPVQEERACLSGGRTARRLELQKRKGGEKEKEGSEVAGVIRDI
ncbi:uncharacterized protein LOC141930321 [Strix aluco]|uniref:uncharacterized protein LOC141930320 n=1 Tax=Strix aluco TaxID=111821 RepID=UPI003DA4DC2D